MTPTADTATRPHPRPEVTTAAVAAAARDDYPGEPWQVPKFYWTVLAESAFEAGWNALDRDDLLPEWVKPPREEFDFGYSDDKIDAVVETDPEARARKRRRLPRTLRKWWSPDRTGLCPFEQHGAANRGRRALCSSRRFGGDRDERGWETDLLAGLI